MKRSKYQREVLRDRPAVYLPLDDKGQRERPRLWVNGRRAFGVRGFLNRLCGRIPR